MNRIDDLKEILRDQTLHDEQMLKHYKELVVEIQNHHIRLMELIKHEQD